MKADDAMKRFEERTARAAEKEREENEQQALVVRARKQAEQDELDRVAAHVCEVIATKRMSPRGTLGLPALLDERRFQFGMCDKVFSKQAAFDRILVFQIPPAYTDGETYGDTSIIIPDKYKQRVKEESPRGVIVSAGLRALDSLRSNGMDIGHIIDIVRLSPWRLPVDFIDGVPVYLLILRDADIVSSEDTAEQLRKGELTIKAVDGEHQITGTPIVPTIGDDF